MLQKSLLSKATQASYLAGMTSACGERHFSAGEKALKNRMKSVRNIGKVTKAMKMISATKMKKDLIRLEGGKHFGLDAVDMIFKSDAFLQKKMPYLH